MDNELEELASVRICGETMPTSFFETLRPTNFYGRPRQDSKVKYTHTSQHLAVAPPVSLAFRESDGAGRRRRPALPVSTPTEWELPIHMYTAFAAPNLLSSPRCDGLCPQSTSESLCQKGENDYGDAELYNYTSLRDEHKTEFLIGYGQGSQDKVAWAGRI